jgi:transposase InsO family protein
VRFAFIEAEKAQFPVTTLCKMLEVRTSGFYAWRTRGESRRRRADRRLAVEVRAAFGDNHGRYGSPRLYRALRANGVDVGRHRVARLMREQNLRARRRRRFCATTDSRHTQPTAPNLLGRDFAAPAPNRVWAGDVTYVPTREGWLFLAVLLDLYSRRVVGWAMSNRNDEELTLAALRMALEHRAPAPGLIHHSDRGTTYASCEYQAELARHGLVASMSRKGDCWDNAVVESFFSTLDTECGTGEPFTSRLSARRAVAEYILGFYNPTRLHSYLDYRSPMEFERLNH